MGQTESRIEAVLVTAKKAKALYTVSQMWLCRMRVQVDSVGGERPSKRVRAIPYGVRGWRYVSQDIPVAMAEDASIRRAR